MSKPQTTEGTRRAYELSSRALTAIVDVSLHGTAPELERKQSAYEALMRVYEYMKGRTESIDKHHREDFAARARGVLEAAQELATEIAIERAMLVKPGSTRH